MTTKTQQAFDFGRLHLVDSSYNDSTLALHDAYRQASNIVIAGATGIDKGDLSKMFEPGSGRHLRYKAVFAIGALASYELRRRALEPLASCFGLVVSDPKPPLTDKERADTAESVINALGPIAQAAYRDALSK